MWICDHSVLSWRICADVLGNRRGLRIAARALVEHAAQSDCYQRKGMPQARRVPPNRPKIDVLGRFEGTRHVARVVNRAGTQMKLQGM
ncbi:hypothetical protein FHX76_001077 [Lysinibacter cavernae]|uniref:Uncharacterized protein n=1 Tax=Lysinibacter cavernae TaxID=1640652 RepID=A0A7X5R070_9MICO|nr:hypothetical protein [Lysinibacter cavernae]